MREVCVIGIGMNKWGELWQKSLRDIYVEAALEAIKDAGIDHLDSIYVGCMSSGLFIGQEHLGSLLADYLGCCMIPCTRVESACASGGAAFRTGYLEVASGNSDLVMVSGVEKMTDVGTDEATFSLSAAADQEYESYFGVTFPALYAMIARRHMELYGTTREQLAQVAVKNHNWGLKNPNAQFQFKVTLEDVLNSSLVADPLRLLDCSPITDGAAALVLCPVDLAKKISKKQIVKVIGSGCATDTISLHDRQDITVFGAVKKSAEIAYKGANKTPQDIGLAEIHDCFTIAEICLIEDLGFFKKGEGGKATEACLTDMGGKIPVNMSGGLKAKGHPVGATGVAQIYEIVKQLRGEAGANQVKNARVGLTQNMGGTGGSSLVNIFEVI